MKLTKKFETQIWKIYDTWMQAYLNADVETYDSYFDKDYHFIGSTNNEEFLNKKDTTEFFRVTGEQFAGMMDLRNESKTIEQFGDHVLLTHICDTWFKNDDDWSYYGRFRLSSVMINTKEGWKFFYQHFSLPDAKSEDGQSIGFDKINAENQELREAIQRRTKELELKNRELEIETALERIRAQAVAMKASSDLLNIVVTMRNEFLKLGHQAHYFWHMMWLPKKYEKAMTSGDGTKIGFVMELPRHIHGDIPLLAKWEKSKKSTVVYAMNVDEAINYVDKMIDLGDFKNIDPQAPTHDDIKHIGGLTFIMARTSHGEIGYSLPGVVKKPPKEDIDILVKFAGAFDLAHQRFLDLQKAEKQARETQIELGLEKVRSRSMAMHHTSELLDTAAQLFHQLEDLGIKPWRCGMAILNTDDTKFEFWSETTTPKGRSVSVNGTTSITGKTHKHVKGAVKAIKEKKDFYNYDLSGKDLIDYINYITKDFNLPEASQNITELPERLLYYCATFSRGVIYGAFLTTIKDADQQTLKRFAQVFDQTYTRFLDLQKAEAQAREAQIEAALEKVRSRSLAVHKSEEFKDVISIVFEKLKELQIPATAVGIGIKINGSKDLDSYVCGENEEGLVITNYRLPYFNNKISKDICNAFDNEANVFVGQYTKAVKNNFYRYVLDKTSKFKDLPEDILDMIFNSTSYTITMVSSEYVVFNINDFEGKSLTEHEIDIVKRFSRVFNQAYIRFLDLQKSEAQAREAQIEAALERLRSRTMGMQKSDELLDAGALLYKELNKLGINNLTTGYVLFNEDAKVGYSYGVNPANGSIRQHPVEMPHDETSIMKSILKSWKNEVSSLVIELNEEETIKHQTFIAERSKNFPISAEQLLAISPDRLKIHAFNFKQGYLLIIGDKVLKITEQNLVIRFAKAFQQTYTRFLDLQKAEKQARENKIQLGLEKVRAASMAMQNTNELNAVLAILFEQFNILGINPKTIFLSLLDIPNNRFNFRMTGNKGFKGIGEIDVSMDTVEAWADIELKRKESEKLGYQLIYQPVEALPEIWRLLDPLIQQLPENERNKIEDFPNGMYQCEGHHKYGYLGFAHSRPITEEEISITVRFAKEFDAVYQRFHDLAKAEAQAREALIEAALERIRSRSMAMQNSKEFQDVIQVVYNQFELLGLNIDHTGFILDYKNQEDMHIVLADNNAVFPEIRLPYFDCAHWNSFKKAKKNGDTLFTNQLDFKEKNQFYDDIFRFIPDLPKETKTHYLKVPGLAISTVLLDSIGLYIENFEGVPYSDEDNTILMRFGKAFQQTYTRFLDLQKAEAQAREAQIQLSLERVRAKSMAMHSSDQLHDIIGLVFQQFDKLAIHPVNVFLSLFDRQKRILTYRASGKSGKRIPTKQDVEIDSVEAWTDLYNKWINDSSDEIEVLFYPKEIVPDILNLLKDTFLAMPKKDRMTTKDFPEGGYSTLGYTPFGYLGYDHTRPPTEEEKDILKRICTEFGRVYQRFLDLQKAEGQAREAKIETALEKVRSRSMAMHQSDELWEVAELLFEQINGLGIELWSCGFSIWYDDDSYFMGYNPGPDGKLGTPMPIPLTEDVFFTTIRNAKRQGEDFIVFESKGKSLEKTYRYMDKLPVVGEVMRGFVEAGFDLPKFQVTHCGFFSDGHLMFITLDHNPEAIHIFKRFTKVFNQTYTRFLDLQKAEARAKEAQIEAVLERVRSRSLAMHNSDELNDLALVVLKSLGDLGMDLNRRAAGIITFKEDEKDYYQWAASQEYSSVISFLTPYLDHPVQNDIWEARQNNSEFYSKSYTLEEKNTFFSHLYEHTELKTMMSAKDKKQSLSFKYYKVNIAFGKHSALVLVSYTDEGFTEEENNILKRLSKVFEQAYIRFLDLQKAEAQAREAQINLAVERVRAKALAMHKSEEIIEVVAKLKDEVMGLNILGVVAATIFLEAENDSIRMWDLSSLERTDQGYLAITDITFKLKKKDPHLYVKRVWENPEDYFIEIQNSKDLDRIIEFMYENNQLEIAKEVEEYTKSTNLTKLYHASKRLSNGKLCIDLLEEPPEEMQTILNKMGDAFDLAYKRFEDIKKAETQAKEAQIEAALERIRSRSMAMHNTSELSEVILVLFNQFKLLGLTIDTCIIDIFDDLNAGFSVWIGTGTAIYPKQVFLPYMDHPIHQLNKDARQRKIDFFTFDEDKDSKDRYFKHFYANAKGIEVPQERRELIANGVGITGAAALGKHSGVHIWNYRGIKYTNEENDILRRVNKVFQQTYTRFLDLQKAEAREREAIIQASLDRVRAEIASMRDTKDLERITPLVWSELQSLGVPFFRCGVMLVNEDTNILDFYLSNPKGQALAALHLDFDSSDIARNGFEYWQKKEIYIEHWDQNQFIAFMKQLMSQGQITDADTYQGGEIAPTSLTLQFVPFTQGMVYVGSELALSKEELDLVEALGKSLSVAYARYEDFTKLDIAKAKAEKALLDLKSVQQQMIQQEKLASLGQLTAGIAHEIKNPLNFVNNFSDLSIELLDEVFTELEQIPESETKEEILAILKDVKGNLSKVTEHGTRADGIVTSMLQHSRASGSKREPKLFNPLVKEFVNLSFHGMRAGKSPINVKIDLQLDPKVENVTLISEDFSRVILNLCNNAFDAMRDKLIKTKNSSHYSAQLIIQTLKEKNSVTLLIKDNGPGIPDSIKDKILQPFFTTKKGTEGTGLGLSITNDIIKAHGGELSIESKENQGTTFRIQLPK